MKRDNVSVYGDFYARRKGGGGRIYVSTLIYLTENSVDIV